MSKELPKRYPPPTLDFCQIILEKLQSNPICRFFFVSPDDQTLIPPEFFLAHPNPIFLSHVAEKVARGLYLTPDEFYDEVLFVFDQFIEFYQPPFANKTDGALWSLASELRQIFLKKCKKSRKSEAEIRLYQLLQVEESFEKTLRPTWCQPDRSWASGHWTEDIDDGLPQKVDPILYFEV
jgi:hypothetical protein